jgi:fimbrial chaperone protein
MENGQRTTAFFVTPPLYLSRPQDENMLRLIRAGGNLPQDRESLFYFTAKAIPSVDKRQINEGEIRISTMARIKLFVRPKGMKPEPARAPSMLSFHYEGDRLYIKNPTPYYITLSELYEDYYPLKGEMIAPFSSLEIKLPAPIGKCFTFQTINDDGALTAPITVSLK